MAVRLNQYGEIEENSGNCNSCGKPLKQEWVACPNCGATISTGPIDKSFDGHTRIISQRQNFSICIKELEDWAYSGDGLDMGRSSAADWAKKALLEVRQGISVAEIKAEAKKSRHSGGCFISTAVSHSLQWQDDCEELNILRHLRDTFMQQTLERQTEVQYYYHIAPIIVMNINRHPEVDRIWRDIAEKYILPTVSAARKGNPQNAYSIYKRMICQLKQSYLKQQ